MVHLSSFDSFINFKTELAFVWGIENNKWLFRTKSKESERSEFTGRFSIQIDATALRFDPFIKIEVLNMVLGGKVGSKTFFEVATLLASPQTFDRANKQPYVLKRGKKWTMYVMTKYFQHNISKRSKSKMFFFAVGRNPLATIARVKALLLQEFSQGYQQSVNVARI